MIDHLQQETTAGFQGEERELVLVVDDESAIRELTQRSLESFGYRVVTACDGAEAVALYAKFAEKIGLVLTDLMMPVMDGATAIGKIKGINPSAKIVVVSGMEVQEDLKSRVNGFLPKPYTISELAELVRGALGASVAAV